MSTEKLQGGERAFENQGPTEIHINTLVLNGFPKTNLKQFQSAIKGELARLFDQPQLSVVWDNYDEISHVDAGQFEFSVDQGIESVGVSVALSVYKSLSGGRE